MTIFALSFLSNHKNRLTKLCLLFLFSNIPTLHNTFLNVKHIFKHVFTVIQIDHLPRLRWCNKIKQTISRTHSHCLVSYQCKAFPMPKDFLSLCILLFFSSDFNWFKSLYENKIWVVTAHTPVGTTAIPYLGFFVRLVILNWNCIGRSDPKCMSSTIFEGFFYSYSMINRHSWLVI